MGNESLTLEKSALIVVNLMFKNSKLPDILQSIMLAQCPHKKVIQYWQGEAN